MSNIPLAQLEERVTIVTKVGGSSPPWDDFFLMISPPKGGGKGGAPRPLGTLAAWAALGMPGACREIERALFYFYLTSFKLCFVKFGRL